MGRPAVVLGLGNPLMGDDRAGLAALEALRSAFAFEPDVRLEDGGALGLALLPTVEDAGALLVLDAVHLGGPIGTVVEREGDEIPRCLSIKLSPHQVGFRETLALAGLRGKLPARMALVGVEVAGAEYAEPLSAPVAHAVPRMVAAAVARLSAWGFKAQARAVSAAGRKIRIRGTVQGVGFRPWVYHLAHAHGLGGAVRNDASGVTIEAFGDAPALDAFVATLVRETPPGAVIETLDCSPVDARATDGFAIAASAVDGDLRLSIPPERATCDACLAEMADASNRRQGYAFTNCTHCGPRYTIATEAPYDRAATTMAAFEMCPACRREYEDPGDRRFHAEPNACPACGPALVWCDASGAALDAEDPIAAAAAALREGCIVAVKGLGGYHLACDATSEGAVARLRARKGRDEKPFAVMVGDLRAAAELAHLDAGERALLEAPERPIVLAKRRVEAPIAAAVAPDAPLVGLFLPYSPLHHLLLAAVARPLVMTSANRAEEPIAFRDDDARVRLAGLADRFLIHDRVIAAPCDDSVARVIAGRPTILRRGRGWVPRPTRVARAFAQPVLACGAHWKNAVCIGVGDAAWLGPHVGDLESLAAYEALEESVERMCHLLRVRPEIVAHDLHPEFLSTRFARSWPAAATIAVQHHHAHVASAMGEHGLSGPVLGVAYDGTGQGQDGASWGGEILLVRLGSFERIATFRPLRLPGGEVAIRQVWRLALALLDDAFLGDPPLHVFPLFAGLAPDELARVRTLLASGFPMPLSHGVGRLFDAVGSLLLGRSVAGYEGQVALLCNGIAARGPHAPYPFDVERDGEPWLIDLRPMVRSLVADCLAGEAPTRISARFHETLVAATVTVVSAAVRRHGSLPVVLTGGCFQNPRLAKGVRAALAAHAEVYLHADVPPGDGGLALGQALVADARSRSCV